MCFWAGILLKASHLYLGRAYYPWLRQLYFKRSCSWFQSSFSYLGNQSCCKNCLDDGVTSILQSISYSFFLHSVSARLLGCSVIGWHFIVSNSVREVYPSSWTSCFIITIGWQIPSCVNKSRVYLASPTLVRGVVFISSSDDSAFSSKRIDHSGQYFQRSWSACYRHQFVFPACSYSSPSCSWDT